MEIAQTAPTQSPAQAATESLELGSDDFLQLLVTQLTNQDPLEPTSNEDLLQQLSAIRDIDLSTTLADSLKTLVGNERFSAAPNLIGSYITTKSGDETQPGLSGMVVGVQYDDDGKATLDLATGETVPLGDIQSIQSSEHAAASLVGKTVVGVDRSNPENPKAVQGIVTSFTNENDRIKLELDTGQQIDLADIVTVTA